MTVQGTSHSERSLLDWMEREMDFASSAILQGVSAVDRSLWRESFGQRVVPKPGSIVAAPATDLAGGEPDYFFHWLRDSALVMDALRILYLRGRLPNGVRIFDDFAAFSLGLSRLDGPSLLQKGDIRQAVKADYVQYVRPDDQLRCATGDVLLGEVRFNPDGTLDIIRWNRPQNDGPALRALSLLRWRKLGVFGGTAAELVQNDLAYIERFWREPCYDLWEEEFGLHYYTRLVQMAALDAGAEWMTESSRLEQAGHLRSVRRALHEALDLHWSPELYCYLSQLGTPQEDLDSSIILAILHANRGEGAHSVLDPKAQATLTRLEELFSAEYRINASLKDGHGPAMGRYAGDRYVSGGAWYMTTLAAAEFYYQLAGHVARSHTLECDGDNAPFLTRVLGRHTTRGSVPSTDVSRTMLTNALLKRGDAFMATVQKYTPPSGELSEQFDQSTGRQTSAKNLAWSYAAFITAYEARRHVNAT